MSIERKRRKRTAASSSSPSSYSPAEDLIKAEKESEARA
jgi:hypothetical protein